MDTFTNKKTQTNDTIIAQMLHTSRIETVSFGDETFIVRLGDGRVVIVPYYWFPRLTNAGTEVLEKYVLHGKGTIIVWEELQEAISVEMLLLGLPDQTAFARSWRREHNYAAIDEIFVPQRL
jgi:hypothetical protein